MNHPWKVGVHVFVDHVLYDVGNVYFIDYPMCTINYITIIFIIIFINIFSIIVIIIDM